MATKIDRKTFLGQLGTLVGGYTLAGPLQALAARSALGQKITGEGYGELVNKGDLWLPEDFDYIIISRQGDLMSDGNPTPSRFDGMSAFKGSDDNTTILIRNHENKRRFSPTGTVSPANEIDVVVPNNRYDPNPMWNGGVTRLVVRRREVVESLRRSRWHNAQLRRRSASVGFVGYVRRTLSTSPRDGLVAPRLRLRNRRLFGRSITGSAHRECRAFRARGCGLVSRCPLSD
jgi:hypothetical protein